MAGDWPTQVAYQDALQNPRLAFTDTELAASAIADLTPFGLPQAVSGQYANVYRLTTPDGRRLAVRLFLRDLPGREVVYQTFAAHIAALGVAPDWFVPCTYQARGIRIGKQHFPLVVMPYITGEPLNHYISAHLTNPSRLRDLLGRFVTMADSLAALQVAHGDLQHGNILVEPDTGELRLIDYDGVFVPALGKRTGSEIGHPAYQHSARRPGDYGIFMDRFSVLVIYSALVALSHAPELWYRFDNGDNLLFTRDDFAAPLTSRTFKIMSEHYDSEVRNIGRRLQEISRHSLRQIPDLGSMLMRSGYNPTPFGTP